MPEQVASAPMPKRSKHQLELCESRQRYQAIFEQAAVGIARLTLDGHWLEINDRFCDILGYSREELFGGTFRDITLPEDLRASEGFLEGMLKGDYDTYSLEKRYLHKNGRGIWVNLAVSLVRQPSGEPGYVVVIAEDIQARKRAELALAAQEKRFRAVVEATRDGFMMTDVEGRLQDVNEIYCRLSGYRREQLLGMRIGDLDANEDQKAVESHIERVVRKGGDVFETRHRRQNGELWPVEVTVTYSDLDGGRLFAFVRDIRERYLNHAMLKLRRSLSDAAYHSSMEAVMTIGLDAAEDLTDSKIGFFHFVDPDQQNLSLQVWSTNTLKTFCFAEGKGLHYAVSEAGVWVDCVHQRQSVIHNDYAALPHKKGLPEGHTPLIRELTAPIFRDRLIVGVIGVGNKETPYNDADITLVQQIGDLAFDYVERKRAESHIEHMAFYDLLTGLPNRSLLFDRIKQAMAQVRRTNQLLGLAYLDLDGFKPVNDRFGHEAGDKLLVAVGRRLEESLREGDTVARIGGDEFALALTQLGSARECEIILERMVETLQEPFAIAGSQVTIGASIGFTLYPIDDADAGALLRHADQAMYLAKSHGKAQHYLYDPTQDRSERLHQEGLAEIRNAMEGEELALYYQPKIDLASGEVVGYEALLRWNHPQRGLLRPPEFFHILDGAPEEIRLGEWVIEHALEQIAVWQEAGPVGGVSVNISPNHLRDPGFADFVRNTAVRWRHKTIGRLDFEVVESAAATDFEILAKTMQACRKLGIQFALDDFGAGYSSLSHLQRLPIDLLKIDQHFVGGMAQNPDDLTIVEGILHFARAYQKPVIAEGVESLAVAALLLDLGCPLAQGYAFAHPMPAERVLEWQRNWPQDPRCQDLRRLDPDSPLDRLLQLVIQGVGRWGDTLIRFIETQGHSERPLLSAEPCDFTPWYNGLGRLRYGARPGYPFLAAKFRSLRLLGAELVALIESARPQRAAERLPELRRMQDELVKMLERLGQR